MHARKVRAAVTAREFLGVFVHSKESVIIAISRSFPEVSKNERTRLRGFVTVSGIGAPRCPVATLRFNGVGLCLVFRCSLHRGLAAPKPSLLLGDLAVRFACRLTFRSELLDYCQPPTDSPSLLTVTRHSYALDYPVQGRKHFDGVAPVKPFSSLEQVCTSSRRELRHSRGRPIAISIAAPWTIGSIRVRVRF